MSVTPDEHLTLSLEQQCLRSLALQVEAAPQVWVPRLIDSLPVSQLEELFCRCTSMLNAPLVHELRRHPLTRPWFPLPLYLTVIDLHEELTLLFTRHCQAVMDSSSSTSASSSTTAPPSTSSRTAPTTTTPSSTSKTPTPPSLASFREPFLAHLRRRAQMCDTDIYESSRAFTIEEAFLPNEYASMLALLENPLRVWPSSLASMPAPLLDVYAPEVYDNFRLTTLPAWEQQLYGQLSFALRAPDGEPARCLLPRYQQVPLPPGHILLASPLTGLIASEPPPGSAGASYARPVAPSPSRPWLDARMSPLIPESSADEHTKKEEEEEEKKEPLSSASTAICSSSFSSTTAASSSSSTSSTSSSSSSSTADPSSSSSSSSTLSSSSLIPSSAHSVVDFPTFLHRFHIMTSHMFAEWTHWDHMLVLGGAVVGALLPVPDEYAHSDEQLHRYYHEVEYGASDVDIYLWGLDEQQLATRLQLLHEHLCSLPGNQEQGVLVVRTQWTLTFYCRYPNRKVQLVLGRWSTLEELLLEPDVACTCVGFDGKRVWAGYRALVAFNLRWLVPSARAFLERRHPEYEERLYKYSRRGFYISSVALRHPLSRFYSLVAVQRLLEHRGVEGRTNVFGLRLLLAAYQHPWIESNVNLFVANRTDLTPYDSGALPYGPDVDVATVRARLIAEEPLMCENQYGVSSAPSPYKLIDAPFSATLVRDQLEFRSIYEHSPCWWLPETAQSHRTYENNYPQTGPDDFEFLLLYSYLLEAQEESYEGDHSVAHTIADWNARCNHCYRVPEGEPLNPADFPILTPCVVYGNL